MRDRDQALTIRLPSGLHQQLKERAEAEERTMAGLLRMLAKEYVAEPQPLGRHVNVGG